MSYQYERRPERRRGRCGCLAWTVALIWIVLLVVLGYRFLFRQQVSQFIGQQLGQQLGGDAQGPVGDQIDQGAQQVLPTALAALPSGELRVSEQQANEYLAANAESLDPIDSVVVRFIPGEAQADITARGATSTLRTGMAVQEGRLITVDPQIDGLLGHFVSVSAITRSLEERINGMLAAQGRRISDVRITQGELILKIEE